MPFYKTNVRLPRHNYLGKRIYFVTLCAERRAPIFSDQQFSLWLLKQLFMTAANHNFLLHAYCVMPDHVHILAEGRSDSSDLIRFVESFKQHTAYEFRKTSGSRLWQMRFYDHILRASDKLESVAQYIWANPVRRGLSDIAASYSLSGSQTIDWKERTAASPLWQPPWKVKIP